jgi:PAS domain S-box-containing protein
MPPFLPRTIRGQLIVSIVLLQLVLVSLFLFVMLRTLNSQMAARRQAGIEYQARVFARVVGDPLEEGDVPGMYSMLNELRTAPTTRSLRVTNLDGALIAYEDHLGGINAPPLSAAERALLPKFRTHEGLLTINDGAETVAAFPIQVHGRTEAVAWMRRNDTADANQLQSFLMIALGYSWLTLMGDLAVALLLTRLISKPVRSLLAGTRALSQGPEMGAAFPLPVSSTNELGDLTRAFNGMVAALREQRAGLSETLALLDSLLANAPIGFCFFDRTYRYVRINQHLADINGVPMREHIGRSIHEILSAPMATQWREILEHVFSTGEARADIEMHGIMPSTPDTSRSWLTSFYPIRTNDRRVRWVGAVVVEITERRQSEEALRRTEKLAAAGRLAASIAHEINNPLEAVTNLLYLLRNHPGLDSVAFNYADMAQAEIARVSQITQQTLRFYRQSSHPSEANVAELMDSVLILYHGRTTAARVEVELKYSANGRMLCFAGEMRQLFANLVGNSLDVMPEGGRLKISVRDSTSWCEPGVQGIRVSVADTGTGMTRETRQRIFEPFFTTKEATGTGLGLWVSAEIIAKHSGIVRVRSRTGDRSGTIFMLFFPHNGLREGTDHRPPTAC